MPLDPTNWKTPASALAEIVSAKIPSFVLGVNLFVGMMPDKIDNCVCIMDTGGGEQDPTNAIDDVSFQIYSRNESYQTGYNLQNLIKSELQSMDSLTLNNENFLGVWVKSNIAFMGRDESERSLFSSNYRAKIATTKTTIRI
jgi:hypothetical protein